MEKSLFPNIFLLLYHEFWKSATTDGIFWNFRILISSNNIQWRDYNADSRLNSDLSEFETTKGGFL